MDKQPCAYMLASQRNGTLHEMMESAILRGKQLMVEEGWLCGTGSFFVRFNDEISREYILLLLRSDSVRKYLAGEAVGTTMVNFNHGIIKKMPLAIPPSPNNTASSPRWTN
ncbi:MAG: hypothetical protein NTX45_28640 [Proteobacteria bacterium]|nr:hypothetical protein [Pseudomonadota bacterium]